MLRKIIALGVLLGSLSCGATSPAWAQDNFPDRPITLICPLPAGGGVDTSLRGLAQEMQKSIGQPVLVEARPGASGTIAGSYVAHSKPDGYIMGLFQSPQAIPEVYSAFLKPPYKSEQIRPVVRYMSLVFGMPSRPDAPWKTMGELVEYIKANPNKVRWGHTIGPGHPLHLLTYSLLKKHDLKVIEVPFKGAADAITALLGGHIDVAFGASVTATAGHAAAGRIKVLAIHNPTRLPNLPDVPTFAEQGLDPGVMPVYNTFFVPKATPDAIVTKLHNAVKKAMETPELIEFAKKNGYELYYGSVSDVETELKRDREVTASLIEAMQKDKATK